MNVIAIAQMTLWVRLAKNVDLTFGQQFYFIVHLYMYIHNIPFSINCIGGVMVGAFATSVVDRGFESRSGQAKDYKIGICCFSAKHTAIRRKSKDEWSDISTCGLLFQ